MKLVAGGRILKAINLVESSRVSVDIVENLLYAIHKSLVFVCMRRFTERLYSICIYQQSLASFLSNWLLNGHHIEIADGLETAW